MYPYLLPAHSIMRWIVLLCICLSVYRAFTGLRQRRAFTRTDNALRHWTATTAHIQLMIGMLLYIKSPVVQYFWKNRQTAFSIREINFYALTHAGLMLAAIVILTTGSALTKRKTEDQEKFRAMLCWFSLALLIIFLAVPWPFSPLSGRPYFRNF
ncbi:hypothetical protein [Chitinophaga solisilvae]|uniref:Uncharacterized protein n=1 Tax=Chitinophaga solisilvae TaxID=1233460 RepID=A0A3S1JJ38_9BACT|nr:hypothetical protein [Chitinophaga solisilvae]NSL85753.1 hypothetical protein [Chitinophaga solisilvae]